MVLCINFDALWFEQLFLKQGDPDSTPWGGYKILFARMTLK